MRSPRERILDMLEAIDRIERYAIGGRSAFAQDELIQTWVVHHLQIVGEAAARLGHDFHETHPQLAWAQVVAMRNVLVHDYFGIDIEEVWQVIERDLPDLRRKLQSLAESLGDK